MRPRYSVSVSSVDGRDMTSFVKTRFQIEWEHEREGHRPPYLSRWAIKNVRNEPLTPRWQAQCTRWIATSRKRDKGHRNLRRNLEARLTKTRTPHCSLAAPSAYLMPATGPFSVLQRLNVQIKDMKNYQAAVESKLVIWGRDEGDIHI